jgi:predicted RNA-binding protein with PUA-like domain
MSWWLVKQEPESYAFAQFLQEKKTLWTGVRNYQARNNLRAMKVGDNVFYYHSGEGKEIVGLAKVTRAAYPDPTAEEGDWVAVELQAVKALAHPVTLVAIKKTKALQDLVLVRNSRLSVQPVTLEESQLLLKMAT